MELFKCKDCNQEKDRTQFSINRGSRSRSCKECNKLYMVEHRKTKLGLLAQIYGDQVKNSRKRFMKAPAYTLKEFQAFAILDYSFNYLYSTWKGSGYTSGLNPSCDRINDYLPYSFDNIQFISWKENNTKSHQDVKAGRYIKTKDRAILQIDLEGNIIKEWIKIAEAERAYNTKLADALKRGKLFQGFYWKHLDNHLLDLLNEIEGTDNKPKEKIHHSQINFDEDTCLVSINHIQ